MSFYKATLALVLTGLPAIAPASGDPRFGIWICDFGATPFGTLVLSQSTYSFTDEATGVGSSGGVSWAAETFGLQGGGLLELGIHSGLVYAPPDQPGVMAVDLYADMGTVATCHRQ